MECPGIPATPAECCFRIEYDNLYFKRNIMFLWTPLQVVKHKFQLDTC